MLTSYILKQYPKGKVRRALKDHLCNGNPGGHDPGCGRPITEGDYYFDTGVRNEFFEAGRFCARCAMLEPTSRDLFVEDYDLNCRFDIVPRVALPLATPRGGGGSRSAHLLFRVTTLLSGKACSYPPSPSEVPSATVLADGCIFLLRRSRSQFPYFPGSGSGFNRKQERNRRCFFV